MSAVARLTESDEDGDSPGPSSDGRAMLFAGLTLLGIAALFGLLWW